jgi:epoxyqueuosine reductase
LVDVLSLDRAAFNMQYKGTPIARAKRRGLLRNACVAAANWGSVGGFGGGVGGDEVIAALRNLLHDEEPLVREHAAWALQSLNF